MDIIQQTNISSTNLFFLIKLKGHQLYLYALRPIDEVVDDEQIKKNKVSFKTFKKNIDKYGSKAIPDKFILNTPINKTCTYAGSSILDIESMKLKRLWTDYSIFECTYNEDYGPGEWSSLFVIGNKSQDYTVSDMLGKNINKLGHSRLHIPFAQHNFKASTLSVRSNYKPLALSRNLKIKTERFSAKVGSRSWPWWLNFFWSVKGPNKSLKVKENSSSNIQLQLMWNKDNSICREKGTVKVECDAGYLPYRRISFDSKGSAELTFVAQGLKKNDKVELIFSSENSVELGNVSIVVS